MSTSPVNDQDRATWQVCSVLLGYPDEHLMASVDLVGVAVAALPPDRRAPLQRLLHYLTSTPALDRCTHYVELFDHQRRSSLYLTYYAFGDTRRRGMALLSFKQAYRQAGVVLGDDELPDHLAVLLEFAATVEPAAGRDLLLQHRAGIELLRLALADAASPYANLLVAVCATLPALTGDEREAVAQLVAQGPPAEEVGLEAYR